MAAFHFELVAPERLLFSGDVQSVMVPGSEGDMTILKDHAPVMVMLRPGIVELVTDKETKRLFVRGGFLDMSSLGLSILAEQAVPIEELNAVRLDAEIRNAEDDLRDAAAGEAKRQAGEKLDQLRELKAALKL
jgi:F-type H+-transporting ATPase subunit epsilon